MGESADRRPAEADGGAQRTPGDARRRRFEALALPHLDAAYNLARWLSHNPGDADDIVQDAYLRAFRFFDSFRGDSARPWLLAIVRRVWYDEWRRRASSAEVAVFDDTRDDLPPDGWETAAFDPETLVMRAQDAQRVHDALERLPAGYREVLILREMEELSYREIATVIDAPVGTVMSRLARARGRLAVLLGARNEERAATRGTAHPDHAGSADGGLRAGPRCATPAAETGTAPGRECDGPGSRQREARDEL
jgi:RNA polymerase sigma-70 factor (ECF subfamily)